MAQYVRVPQFLLSADVAGLFCLANFKGFLNCPSTRIPTDVWIRSLLSGGGVHALCVYSRFFSLEASLFIPNVVSLHSCSVARIWQNSAGSHCEE